MGKYTTTKEKNTHVGQALRDAFAPTGFTQDEIATEAGIGRTTLTRWFATPNLPRKKVDRLHKAWHDRVDFKHVYQTLARQAGDTLPGNPYVAPPIETSKGNEPRVVINLTISIPIPTKKGRPFVSPPDIEQRIKQLLENYNTRFWRDHGYDPSNDEDAVSAELSIAAEPETMQKGKNK